MSKIKVLVIDDSAFNRRALVDILSSSPDIEVIGTAVDGEDGLKKLIQLKPDVVTLDLEMPVMDGFTFIRMTMASAPTPIVVVSSKKEDVNVFKAMDLGAVDFMAKPTAAISTKLFNIKDPLIEKVKIASQTKLSNVKERITNYSQIDFDDKRLSNNSKVCSSEFKISDTELIEVVAIGSSTGGPSALKSLFTLLPVNLDVAVVVSQHMPPNFTSSFAQRLNETSEFLVKEARRGEVLEKGKVLIAPGGFHMTFQYIGGNIITELTEGVASDSNVPSVDKMFNSIAELMKSKVVAVVLTGMGSDGKEGVVTVNKNGGKVIAESEKTAVVFGMPNEAIKTGVVDEIIPLDKISDTIVRVCNYSKNMTEGRCLKQ